MRVSGVTPRRARRNASDLLLAQAEDLESPEAAGGESLLREAAFQVTTGSKNLRICSRKPRLRLAADMIETLRAFQVLRSRVDELTVRLDRTYEEAERDEVELEALLETIEAAAHDTMDVTADEDGELDEDYSTDDDDTDIDFAASLGAPPARGLSIRTTPIRGSAAQGKAEGLDPEVIKFLTPRELSRRLKAVAVSAHPTLSRHKPAGA
jgi:hypothetical protein